MTNRDALKKALSVLREVGFGEASYGGFHGGDPRDFHPDPECSTEDERARHRGACEAWNRGERPVFRDKCGFQKAAAGEVDGHTADGTPYVVSELGANFGLGTNQSSEECAVVERLYDLLAKEPE